MSNRQYFVYIMASPSGTLYVGITNSILRRGYEHKNCINDKSFTKKYSCNKLVYVEFYDVAEDAIRREKQIKKWRREKKMMLIKKENPHWNDLWKEYIE